MEDQFRPAAVMKELGLLSWPSLAVGLDHDWATKADVIHFAEDQLVRDVFDPNCRIAMLASAEAMSIDEVRDLLLTIIRESGHSVSSVNLVALKQWRLAHLIAAERQGNSPEELLDHVAEIYAEFGFPDDMWLTSRYNLTPEDRRNLKEGKLAHDPLAAVSNVIEALQRELLSERASEPVPQIDKK